MFPIPPCKDQYRYRALGLLKGVLQKQPKSYAQGLLTTADGDEYPATPGRAQLFKAFTACMETGRPYWFYVNPQPRPNKVLGLSVIRILSPSETELEAANIVEMDPFQDMFPIAPDEAEEGFHLRGDIVLNSGTVTVSVRRQSQGAKQFPPLRVDLQGFLPGAQDGEFWDLQAEREGHELLIMDGSCLLSAPENQSSAE